MSRLRLILIFILFVLIIPKQIFSQQDSNSVDSTMFAFLLTNDFSKETKTEIDTALCSFQILNLASQARLNYTFLSNIGTPSFNLQERLSLNYEIPFFKSLKMHTLSPEKHKFYYSGLAYTRFDYTNAGGKDLPEQTVNFIHTQNISPRLNIGARYKLISSTGQYQNQSVKDNSFSVWTTYIKRRYKLNAAFNRNKFKFEENGGLVSDSAFVNGSYESTEYIPMQLSDAKAIYYNNSLLINQSYSLGNSYEVQINDSTTTEKFDESSKLSYTIIYQKIARTYYDDPLSGFYNEILIDSTITEDSTANLSFHNILKWDADSMFGIPFHAGISAFHEYEQYSCLNNKNRDNNIAVGAELGSFASNYLNFFAKGKIYLSGYKSGDFILSGFFDGKIPMFSDSLSWKISGGFEYQQAHRFYNNYLSNNFQWENNFDKQGKLWLEGNISIPKLRLNINSHYQIIDNFIYFNSSSKPEQFKNQLNVISFKAKHEAHLWKFTWINSVYFQAIDKTEVLHLPKTTYYTSLFFEQYLFKNVIRAQLGLDFRTNSNYYLPAYNPALGTYFLQNEYESAFYPMLDAFLVIKLKTVRFYLKYEHLTQGYAGNEYFMSYHYPENPRLFKVGLSWSFYDLPNGK